jgi:hypothetical protein
MSLAPLLGMTVEELRHRMTWREYRLWMARYKSNPWGPERSDLMLAQIAAVIANCHSSGTRFTLQQFLPKFGTRSTKRRKTDADLKRLAIKANAMLGGTVRR